MSCKRNAVLVKCNKTLGIPVILEASLNPLSTVDSSAFQYTPTDNVVRQDEGEKG